jgi:hypothetical protein
MIRFYKWSDWTDIKAGTDEFGCFFVLQSRRREDGKIEMRVEKTKTEIITSEKQEPLILTLLDFKNVIFLQHVDK